MPSVDTTVGPLAIPAPVDAANAPFAEPTTENLLAYIRFWMKWGLDDKIATMTAPAVTDAVPIANAYTSSPSNMYLSRQLPALFVYWTGKSKTERYSISRTMRIRDFAVLYVWERVKNPDGVALWSGLTSTVDALLARAFDRLAHPAFTIDGSHPVGQDIRDMFRWMGVEYMGGSDGFLQELPTAATRQLATAAGKAGANKAQGGIQSGYPAFNGIVRVWEEIGVDTMLDPDDVNRDIAVTVSGGDGAADVVPMLERILTPPDGSAEAEEAP